MTNDFEYIAQFYERSRPSVRSVIELENDSNDYYNLKTVIVKKTYIDMEIKKLDKIQQQKFVFQRCFYDS